MGLGSRIIQLRKENGYTREKLAEILGISPYTLRNYELEVPDAGHPFLIKVSDFFNVSIDYLMGVTEEREKMTSYSLKSSEYSMIEKYRFISTHSPDGTGVVDTVLNNMYSLAKKLKEQGEQIQKTNTEISEEIIPMRIINYYYRVASAGTGQIIFDMPPTKHIEIPNTPEYRKVDYAIGVNGNSMKPKYHDDDILLVEMAENIEIGDIGIFRVNDESYVKKLGKTELISLNPDAKNIPLNERAGCMGKVVGKLSNDIKNKIKEV